MANRSLQACPAGVEKIAYALTAQGLSQEKLDEAYSSATLKKFCRGGKIDRRTFVKLCEKLGLNWEEIAGIAAQVIENVTIGTSVELVQKFRDRIRPHLQTRCGTMRVLDMSQPIGLDDIYTSVNILEKITGRRRLELSELLRNASAEQVERFGLGAVREERVPGLVAVEKYSKLMILGKPGAGKTTFLKHLAIQCIGGRFQPQRVPIFITLKEFAESQDRPDLPEYIRSYLESTKFEAIRELLDRGNALILLDGLDEIREADVSHVLRQIQQLSERYHRNQFVVTCRIAAREYTFEQFTEVEVADFNDEQIADFSSKWFRNREDEVKGDRFLKQLKAYPPIKELATSPLLLILLCLVFEDSGDFPTNRSELYQNGVDVLLKKWDVKRNIERDQIYKKLALKRKEDLLSQIAYRTFKAGNYFFKQKDLERQIREFIENLPGASIDEQELELDSEMVLKSIEAQHGLFVERARRIYSFSHLTFHEHFTTNYIVSRCNPISIDDPLLNRLVSHLTERRWREVFLLIVEAIPDANYLLRLMKRETDVLISGEPYLQSFLEWVDKKAKTVPSSRKQTELRLFYFNTETSLRNNNLSKTQAELAFIFINSVAMYHPFAPDSNILGFFQVRFDFETSLVLDHVLVLALNYASENCLAGISRRGYFPFNIGNKKLKQKLKALWQKLPDERTGIEEFRNWWKDNGSKWTQELRLIMNNDRNLAHDWKFSDEQIAKLQKYYYANLLLIDCLDKDYYISRNVQKEIKETLLLPIAEIQNLQSSESKP